jgi:hypothetical protein
MKMPGHRIYAIPFAKIYPMYIQKAERKGRTKKEVDQILCWLTGYTQAGLQQQIKKGTDLENFLNKAPKFNPKSALITGVVCGIRVEEIKDPLMKKIRYMDKLFDELAKGKAMEKILRTGDASA